MCYKNDFYVSIWLSACDGQVHGKKENTQGSFRSIALFAYVPGLVTETSLIYMYIHVGIYMYLMHVHINLSRSTVVLLELGMGQV